MTTYEPLAAWRAQTRAIGSTSSSRCGAACARSRSASTTRTGSRIPTSTSTSTCATPRWRRRATTTRSASWSPASSAGRSTGAGRCGRATSSRGCPTAASRILTKVHHATVDGASGVELLTMMLDADPAGDDVPPPERAWTPERVPSDGEMIVRGLGGLVRKPGSGRAPDRASGAGARPGHPQPRARRRGQPGPERPARAGRRGAQRRPAARRLDASRWGRSRRSRRRAPRSTRRSRRTAASPSGRCRCRRSRTSSRRSAPPSTTW